MTLTARTPLSPNRLLLVTITAIAGSTVCLLVAPTTSKDFLWLRWTAIMALAWWLPGVLLVAHWRLRAIDLPTALVLGAALGLGWMVVLLLVIHWLPGPLAQSQMIVGYAIGALLLAVGLIWHPPQPLAATSARTWSWVLALLLLSTLLRMPGLGYHEFHFDEVALLARAREAITGDDTALERHTKGPGEIAVETVVLRALDTTTESTARLPFALTSAISVLALAVAGRSLYSAPVGVWAGVLLAVNGFAIGLSRIAQYQPAVLLYSILAVFAAWEFSRSHAARWLALAIVFAVGGTVMHYELALVWPAIVLAAWFGWRPAPRKMLIAITAFSAVTVSALIAGATTIRQYLNPYFATTASYLETRLGTVGETFNLPFFVEMSTFYNSTWFAAGLVLLMIAGLVLGWRWRTTATAVLIFWFLPYLVAYLFIVQFPGTHFYMLMPSWSLLAALPLAGLSTARRRNPLRLGSLWGALLFWLASSIFYIYLLFFRQSPEYVIHYQTERLPFFWAPYGENIPAKPRFGFPIYEGWQTLGVLAEWHYLTGTYASNEYSRHLRWYLGGLERVDFDAQPDFIFVAEDLQEPDPAFGDAALEGYQRIGEIQVRNEPRIALWSRSMMPGGYVTYHAEQFARIFPGLVPALHRWPEPSASVLDVPLDDDLDLVSASVDRTHIGAGDTLLVRTKWLTHRQLEHDYKLFVHLADASGMPVAQWDGMPRMNSSATSHWAPGEIIPDRTFVTVPKETAAGTYTLLIGLYDPVTGERVGGQPVEVATIAVR